MKLGKMFYAAASKEWRAWLKRHYKVESEIWLVSYRKAAGKQGISYNDAVEEALCFGWIDSTVKKVDGLRFVHRFSPRKPGSTYSQANKERLTHLLKIGKISVELRPGIKKILDEKFQPALDILEKLRSDNRVWKKFRRYPESYRRIRIAFIEGARNRPDEFKKRLRYLMKMTAENKMFGYGGIEKYYR